MPAGAGTRRAAAPDGASRTQKRTRLEAVAEPGAVASDDEGVDDFPEDDSLEEDTDDAYVPPDEDEPAPPLPRTETAPGEDEVVDIEQEDFARLINAFTEEPSGGAEPRRPGRASGAGKSSWNQSMEAEMESFHHELRDLNGYARKRKPTRIREQTLSAEVKALLAQANIAYVEANLPGAIKQLEEVIRIEPTVKSAWYTLGMCFEEMGEEEKSIQCRIVGAHLTSNASDEWKSLARRSRERGLYQQSIYCLQQAIKKNRFDVDAIWDRAVMLKDSGRLRAAVEAFQAILRIQPYDAEVLRELIPLLVSLGEYDVGVGILENMRRAAMSPGTTTDPNLDPALASEGGAQAPFTLNELVTLADLLLLLGRALQVVLVIKQTIRWMRGKPRDDRPEDAQNDLELDEDPEAEELDHEVRLRLGKSRLMLRDVDEGRRHFSVLASETEPAEQPMLFLEMADCYFEHRFFSDALEWYRVLLDEGLIDDQQAWLHLGVCYQNLGMPQEAAQVFETIVAEHAANLDVKLRLAEVYEELGQRDRALQLVNEVVGARSETQEADASTVQAAASPAPPAADEEQAGASLSFFNEFGAQTAEGAAGAPGQVPVAPGMSARGTRASISFAERQRLEQQREEETRLAWIQLSALESRVFVDGFWHHDFVFAEPPEGAGSADAETRHRFDAARQWMQVAERLVHSFRSMSLLFPKERFTKYRGVVKPRRSRRSKASDLDSHAEELLSRLRDHLVDESGPADGAEIAPEQTTFRTVPFDDWVALFMKYGVALAKLGENEAIDDMFRHVMVSNTVWPSEERKLALHLCWLSCALYARDPVRVFDIVRWLPTHYQFHNEPLRLIISIANGLGFYGVDAFVSPTNTKQYQRRMRTHEAIVAGKPARINPRTGRWTTVGADEENDPAGDDISLEPAGGSQAQPKLQQSVPTKSSPVGEIFYGYLMLCANSYQPAMGTSTLSPHHADHSRLPVSCLCPAVGRRTTVSPVLRRQPWPGNESAGGQPQPHHCPGDQHALALR